MWVASFEICWVSNEVVRTMYWVCLTETCHCDWGRYCGTMLWYHASCLELWCYKVAITSAVSFVIPITLKVCHRPTLGQVRGVCSGRGYCPGGRSAHSVLAGPFSTCMLAWDRQCVATLFCFWAAVQGPTLWGRAMIVNSAASLAWNSGISHLSLTKLCC